jgi:hypothetical protein
LYVLQFTEYILITDWTCHLIVAYLKTNGDVPHVVVDRGSVNGYINVDAASFGYLKQTKIIDDESE